MDHRDRYARAQGGYKPAAGRADAPTGKASVPIFGNRVKRKICPNRKYFCFPEIQISAT